MREDHRHTSSNLLSDGNGTDLSEIPDDWTGLAAGQESQQSDDSRQSEAMACLLTRTVQDLKEGGLPSGYLRFSCPPFPTDQDRESVPFLPDGK